MKTKGNFNIFIKTLKIMMTNVPLATLAIIINFTIDSLIPSALIIATSNIVLNITGYLNNTVLINSVVQWGVIFLIIYAVKGLNSYIYSISLNAYVYEKLNNISSILLVEKTTRLNLLKFEDSKILDMKQRAQQTIDYEIISQLFHLSLKVIKNIITVSSIIITLSFYNKGLIIIAIISALPHLINRLVRGKSFYQLKFKQSSEERELNYLWQLFSNKDSNKELKLLDTDRYVGGKYSATLSKLNNSLWNFRLEDSKRFALCEAFVIVGYGISIFMSFYLATVNLIHIGQFSSLIAGLKRLQDATKDLLIDIGHIPNNLHFVANYFAYLGLDEDKFSQGLEIDKIDSIKLKNVSFSYPNSKNQAISNIDLTIKEKEKILIIGVNGSGKTTLKNVILGLYDSYSGTVKINSKSINNINKNSFYKLVSIVNQDAIKYMLELKDNIVMSDLARMEDEDRINESLDFVNLSYLKDNEEGLNLRLGREFAGKELSGGEWQRLSLSRAYFKEAELMVLDEPTSALDPIEETKVLKKFLELSNDITSIIISHRVGLARFADRIIVMKDGFIVEEGNHVTLIQRDGEYRKLYESQAKWYV